MKIVFFTGAGVSAESGISTFRDYNGEDNEEGFETLLTLSYFKKHPDITWKWLNGFIESSKNAKPNKAHELIASIKDAAVITQNIDTFHQMAGSKNVIELHGSLGTCTCLQCKKVQPIIDKCIDCGSYTKPDFVFYEEGLNQNNFALAEQLAAEADIFIIVGSSGIVYPANEIPYIASRSGAKIYDINPGNSSYHFNHIKMKASEGLEYLIKELNLI